MCVLTFPSPRAFLAEASAQESQDSKTVAVTRVMRYADSWQLLPQRDATHGECMRAAAKPQCCAVLCCAARGEGFGFRVWLVGDRKERAAQLMWSLGSWLEAFD